MAQPAQALPQRGLQQVSGRSPHESLYGFDGNDTLDGGAGADTMFGANGNDIYVVDDAGDVFIEVSAGGGTDLVLTSVTRNLTANIENLVLTGGGSITGYGNVLDNNLVGNVANNSLYGFDGADELNGQGGDDLLFGGNGDDVLDGSSGTDTLTGAAGADTFAFSTSLGPSNVDTIVGFSVADDTIELAQSVFSMSVGALDANAFVIGAAAADADDRIVYNSSTGQLFYDADGNGAGAQVLFAVMAPGLALTSADFIIGTG
ncbi:MAG: calcium-binding protein [Caulobacteraceae bacterium]|nr:calcium-binding protein [Caulobacteraceae bacterium]